eukprot:912042-Pyramimonas_sp.AAC.1
MFNTRSARGACIKTALYGTARRPEPLLNPKGLLPLGRRKRTPTPSPDPIPEAAVQGVGTGGGD